MKKVIALLIALMLLGALAMPALAAPEGPVITMQPQNPNYPEYSVAIYTVKATGTNLTATWYIEFEGTTYNASQIGGAMQPWEGYAGESYGAKKVDANTFSFVFEGIGKELSGAKIWCVIEDGHYDVTSQVGYISVGNYATPPEILSMPAQITVNKGEDAELRCVAKSGDGSQLNFLWYETATGKLPDIQAIDRGAETGDFMFCDTSKVGTYYYVCGITSTAGGMAYSSVVEVNVVEAAVQESTAPTESTQNEATQAAQNESTQAATEPAPETIPTEEQIVIPGNEPTGFPWWALVLVGLGAAGAGVVVAILLIKKK